ncbi:aminoglycoside phosphotransferase family protein [Microbispora corallina]|uniref:Hydroxyurea phosphotransferase n=1 Tax=Microbispora corallina TaxID=83302 RepID=A0ABQ4GBW4_9ACTN|nr:aminoglycoside phosphotransferase family protein [Microbispora corallina]GIH44520.1 hydroxyurea phosphotransferase [Microbispora corallina]
MPYKIEVPRELAASHARHSGDAGRAWIEALPDLAASFLDRWDLTPDGVPSYGVVSLVIPVRRAGGGRAALKLQPANEENDGEPVGLRAWAGAGAVLLLDADPATGTLLLERLDPDRSLATLPDGAEAVRILAGLLARLTALPAPPGLRRLADVAAAMPSTARRALPGLADPEERRLAHVCVSAVRDLLPEPGDRLLHWDLHYGNVLAGEREPWLAIDPKPLAGDPGFDLMPALWNRWDEVVASGDVARAVRARFDLMTETLGLDRRRAAGWTLGRVLQNTLWDLAGGAHRMGPAQRAIGEVMRPLWGP